MFIHSGFWTERSPFLLRQHRFHGSGRRNGNHHSTPVATGNPRHPRSSPQSNYDSARQRYDAVSDQLTQSRNVVINRLANDPNYQAADHNYVDAKNRYDGEIDDALSALAYDDTYQDLINSANRAGAALQSLTELSPGRPDQKSVQYAQARMDDAREQVEDYEDDTLDHDTYVQQARQKYNAARACT